MASSTLSPVQTVALQEVKNADAVRRRIKREGDEIAKQYVAERIGEAERLELEAVDRAIDVGISRNRIGKEGMSSKSPNVIRDLRNKVMGVTPGAVAPDHESRQSSFAWVAGPTPAVKIEISNFPTTISDPDYPAVLSGVVGYDEGEWYVIKDDSDQVLATGTLPGFLHLEIEQVPRTNEGSILHLLDAFVRESA